MLVWFKKVLAPNWVKFGNEIQDDIIFLTLDASLLAKAESPIVVAPPTSKDAIHESANALCCIVRTLGKETTAGILDDVPSFL